MTEHRHSDDERTESERKHERQEAFRGLLGDVCSYAPSNAENPELCGGQGPVIDENGQLLVTPPAEVPHSAPKK